jgi:hypothetical protein
MNKVEFITTTANDGTEVEHAIIDFGDGKFTSMPKSVYDTLPSELNEPSPAEKPKK